MRLLISMVLLFLCPALLAQRDIEKRVTVQNNQVLKLEFDYPEIIKVYTSPTNELLIKGKVSINRGENDNAFELNATTTGNEVKVSSFIRDKDKLPKRTVLKVGDQEYYFKTDNHNSPEIQKFIEEHGGNYAYMNNGVIMDVQLEVHIPKGITTTIDAKYGLVEVLSCEAPLTIIAQYGGVDFTVPVKGLSELSARTRYGEILTNLNQKPVVHEFGKGSDNWTNIVFNLGQGNRVEVESKYGKVYLRKSQ
jgi:hypothetical protein